MSAPRLPTKTMPVPLSDSAGFVAAAISHHPGALPFARAYSAGGDELRNSLRNLIVALGVSALIVVFPGTRQSAYAGQPTYDLNTLAGKVASVRGTAGLQIRFSALIEQEAEEAALPGPNSPSPITPVFVLSSPLDGTSVQAPNVTVNQDKAAASQNETAIAVDPNN